MLSLYYLCFCLFRFTLSCILLLALQLRILLSLDISFDL
jgi:hypothetical protein